MSRIFGVDEDDSATIHVLRFSVMFQHLGRRYLILKGNEEDGSLPNCTRWYRRYRRLEVLSSYNIYIYEDLFNFSSNPILGGEPLTRATT